ncbi:MAG: anti-sigma factor antagonist [Bacteroidetes bacterium]|nr:MAG: anti-sigma factor antagonist [Bacteroidota bacterium]
MDLKFRKDGNATILEISGRLDTSNYESFSEELFKKLEAGDKYIVVDMEDLEYISSSGLRVFLAALKKIREKEGDIALCCMSKSINEVFEISGFSTIFKIYVKMDDALAK